MARYWIARLSPPTLAENHHPGGIGPPEPCESRLVPSASSSVTCLKTMPLGRVAAVGGGLVHGLQSYLASTSRGPRVGVYQRPFRDIDGEPFQTHPKRSTPPC